MESDLRDRIRNTMLELARQRGHAKSLCPSEVARRVMPVGWRDIMVDVRSVAEELAERREIEVLQRGEPVQIRGAKGPVRIRVAASRDLDSRD